jgi:hypothetical protein
VGLPMNPRGLPMSQPPEEVERRGAQ